jgi:hypothetical protein
MVNGVDHLPGVMSIGAELRLSRGCYVRITRHPAAAKKVVVAVPREPATPKGAEDTMADSPGRDQARAR